MYMKDWIGKLDAFLQFNEKEILRNAGKFSHELAVEISETTFEKYRITQAQNYESDFDEELKKINSSSRDKK